MIIISSLIWLFRHAGHLVAPVVAHVLCNVMGLPALGDVFLSSHTKGFTKHIFVYEFLNFLLQLHIGFMLASTRHPLGDSKCVGPLLGTTKSWRAVVNSILV